MLTKPRYSDLFAYDNIFIREVFQGRREALAQDGQELLADVGGDQGFSGNLFFTGRDGAGRGGEPPPPRGEGAFYQNLNPPFSDLSECTSLFK